MTSSTHRILALTAGLSTPSSTRMLTDQLAREAAAALGTGAAGQRSRLGQQVTTGRGRRATASLGPEADEDAEGEDDVEDEAMEENGDQEDEQVYCFCQKLSYGEMVGCDNDDCRYQWVRCFCWAVSWLNC